MTVNLYCFSSPTSKNSKTISYSGCNNAAFRRSGTQEGLVLNVVVGEEERDSFSLLTSDTIQGLQILQQVTAAVRPAGHTHQ